MTLQELFDAAVEEKLIKPTRQGPIQSTVKQYANMHGLSQTRCPPELYYLADAPLDTFVDAHAPDHWERRTVTNFKNNLRFLWRIGIAQGWLDPLAQPLKHWRDCPQTIECRGNRVPRHENAARLIYRLYPVPVALAEEIESYLQWSQRPVQPGRPHTIKKRPTTCEDIKGSLLRMAGFAVHYQDLPAELLTLKDLCEPSLAHAFITWWIDERRGKVTYGLVQSIVPLETIARHYLKDLKVAEQLNSLLNGELAVIDQVRDKQLRWATLAQLDYVGRNLYPLNEQRLKDFATARKVARYLKDPTHRLLPSRAYDLTRYTTYTGLSLIIRLLCRVPLRQRNIREMRLKHNLFQDHAGCWRIRFRGTELKVARKMGALNVYECAWPEDLISELEEYLTIWRPHLAPDGEDHVFLNSNGRIWSDTHLCNRIAIATKRFIGVGVTPHMFRDIWATEYLKQYPGDAAAVAKRLGNTIEMVYRHYAHLLDGDADTRASQFLQDRMSLE
jgi:integrase